jgi:hypothetical protein
MVDPTVHCDCPDCKKLRGERPRFKIVEPARRIGISKNAILTDIANIEEQKTVPSGVLWTSNGKLKK